MKDTRKQGCVQFEGNIKNAIENFLCEKPRENTEIQKKMLNLRLKEKLRPNIGGSQ